MGRSRQLTSVDYSNQLSINMNELDKREKMNVNDVISHRYLQQILYQYERLGLQSDVLLFSIITALGAVSCRSFIRRMDNMPILLNHGSLIVGRTGSNKSSYIKLVRHSIGTLAHHYEDSYYPGINKNGNRIDNDQGPASTSELSDTATKMTKASFMSEVCTELAITKNLATTDTFLCHDEGDVILTTFGFYSPSDTKHAGGVNLICAGLDGLVNYNRTTGRQNIHIENATLSIFLATTGSKMFATLQAMHQKKENVGILGRLNFWYLPTIAEFLPPPRARLVPDVASVDHLLIIAHEIAQKSPEFRFKKHMSDNVCEEYISSVGDSYMKELRREQGITESPEIISSNINKQTDDVFEIAASDFTEEGVPISAFKLVYSILNSEFRLAQQDDEHISGTVRKSPNKFPRICALFCLLEIVTDIASKLLKYIVFEEGDFTRPNSSSDNYISTAFVNAAREHVEKYLNSLPVIDNRPIIYIDKSQVERAFIFYSYGESTIKMLFDTSNINQLITDNEQIQSMKQLSVQEKQDIKWIIKVMKAPVIIFSRNYLSNIIPGCPGSGVLKNASTDVRNNIINLMIEYGLLIGGHFIKATTQDSFAKLPPNTIRQQQQSINFFEKYRQMITLNNYEKLFETFGLMTTTDTNIVPITRTGINLFRDNNYVHYYHCLQKDKGINKMIQERLALNEINIVYDYQSGPYRYQVNSSNQKYNDTLFDNFITSNNEESHQNQPEATNLSSINNNINDVDQNSNTQLVSNDHYHNNEDDTIELTNTFMKFEHEPRFLLIVSDFIDKYQEENVDSTFEENNSAMAYQLLKKFTDWFGTSHGEPTSTLTVKEVILRTKQKVRLQRELKKFIEICQQIMLNYRPEKHHSIIKQQEQLNESFTGDDTRLSAPTKSSISISHPGQQKLTPIPSSPFVSLLFQSVLNTDEDPTVNNNQLTKLQTITEENVSTPLNCDNQSPQEDLLIVSESVSETLPLTTDQTVMICSSNNRSSAFQKYDSTKYPTGNDSDNISQSPNSIEQQQQSTAPFQTYTNSILPNPSEQLLLDFNANENILSTTSFILPSSDSTHSPLEDTLSTSSKSSINKKKRGRKSKTDKVHDLLSDDVIKTILADPNHPIYKRVILLDGFIFSKSYLTHALQQYSSIRDGAIDILCYEGIFIKEKVFAKKNSNGIIEHLDGYIKRSPTYNTDTSSTMEDNIEFANKLAKHNITLEEYISSFDNEQSFAQNSNNNVIKRVLDRTDIHLTSYLFSMKLLHLINNDNFYSQRFTVTDEAVCWNTEHMLPTTSNSAIDTYQQIQYNKTNRRQNSRKRTYEKLQDTAGPPPENSRRRPRRIDQE